MRIKSEEFEGVGYLDMLERQSSEPKCSIIDSLTGKETESSNHSQNVDIDRDKLILTDLEKTFLAVYHGSVYQSQQRAQFDGKNTEQKY